MRGVARRGLSGLLVAGVLTTGLAVVPAAAQGSATTISRASWAYIDIREPRTTFDSGDAPVGAWRDTQGRYHDSKAYFTFDLTAFRGSRILGVSAIARETAANDCTKPRVTELWATDAAERPTWLRQPKERVKLPGPGAPADACLWSTVEWDAKAPVADAVAAGKTSVTFALRMPGNRQFDPAFGRRYDNNVRLFIRYNRAPSTPTGLSIGFFRPCTQPLFIADDQPALAAAVGDPDQDVPLTATFAIWPIDEPTRRTEFTGLGFSRVEQPVPAGTLTDGRTYDWALRTSDGLDSSPWSETCRFTWDRTRPAVPPTVESTDYPENPGPPGTGGPGVEGRFTFGPNGVDDVAGYLWGEFGDNTFVPAGGPGGTATVRFAPRFSGPSRIVVSSVDRAGNHSPSRFYEFLVRDNAPAISSPTGNDGQLGARKEFDLLPGMDNVVEYLYRLNDGPEVVIPTAADGTAHFGFIVDQADTNTVLVQSRTRDGIRSSQGFASFFVDPVLPEVSHTPEDGVAGSPMAFTFRPVMQDVVAYTYQFNSDPEQTVAAAADGTATVEFTPTDGGFGQVTVRSINRAGYRSGQTFYFFHVDSGDPVIESQVYPPNVCAGGVGVPGDFTFSSRRANVVEYRYTLDDAREAVVPAGADGRATITITPDRPQFHFLRVHSRAANGSESNESFYQFCANGPTS